MLRIGKQAIPSNTRVTFSTNLEYSKIVDNIILGSFQILNI